MTLADLNQKWIKDKDIPTFLGIGIRTWTEIRRKDKIPFSKRGSVKFIDIEDLNAWIEGNKKNH